MRYEFKCNNGHVFIASRFMDDFLIPEGAPGDPRVGVCECGAPARQKFTTFQFSMPAEGGFNLAAGTYHRNDFDRIEWMKRSERVETNPFTGKSEVVRPEPICPEQVWTEKAYLKDLREATLDRAPAPVHPSEKLKERSIRESLLQRVNERINAEPREFGRLLHDTPEYPPEVLEKKRSAAPPVEVPA